MRVFRMQRLLPLRAIKKNKCSRPIVALSQVRSQGGKSKGAAAPGVTIGLSHLLLLMRNILEDMHMRSHAWEEHSGMTGGRLAGSLIMAAGASLLGYWLYRLAAGQNQPAGRQ